MFGHQACEYIESGPPDMSTAKIQSMSQYIAYVRESISFYVFSWSGEVLQAIYPKSSQGYLP